MFWFLKNRIFLIMIICFQTSKSRHIPKVRGGPNFDPVKYVKEVSHVKQMHANSNLIHPNFSSKLMITWLNLFENPLLIRFQTDRKLTFDPVRTNESGSKMSFRTIHCPVIDKLFENSILIQFELTKVDQKWLFELFMVTWLINCSKNHFWSTFISSNWIKSEFSISLKADQKWVFEQIESRDH